MNTKVNLNLVLVLAVASVILIPIAYGLVEPSIIINMEVAQTTKPLEIKASNGTTVFSVDPDGTVFPPPPVAFEAKRGAEEIVLNNNFDDGGGGSTITNQFAGVEFTMPTTAPFWKITAIETKTGDTVNTSTDVCATIIGLDEAFPFSADNEVIATRIALTEMSQQDIVIATNTVYKMPTRDSFFVDGGEELIAIVGGCINSQSKFLGQTRTALWSTIQGGDDFLLSGGTLHVNNIVVKATAVEFYIVVYAVPYN